MISWFWLNLVGVSTDWLLHCLHTMETDEVPKATLEQTIQSKSIDTKDRLTLPIHAISRIDDGVSVVVPIQSMRSERTRGECFVTG
jgi:hypothetical protein